MLCSLNYGKESDMRIQNIFLSCVIALMIASPAAAQVRRGPAMPAETKVDLAIKLQVNGQPYSLAGKGVCQHAPVASIYNVLAEMWSVEHNDGQRSIRLTLWRPRSTAGDMFSLSLSSGNKRYLVNTVKVGEQPAVEGSGKVSLRSQAPE